MKALHWRGSVKEWGERKEGRKRKEMNRKLMKKENRRKPEGIKYEDKDGEIKKDDDTGTEKRRPMQ